jgi:hypothetical protein
MKSDCGGEFVNAEMSTMLGDLSVFHSTTSPYSPHQNGIAERSNRTIFDLAAACMHACGLAIKFWTHSVAYVVHTLNYLPNFALNLQSTPYLKVFGNVPDVGYFRVFGCDAYMVLPDTKRPSFGLRAVKGIFVGYNHPHSLSYKILYKGTIYDSGHVYFNEDLKCLTPPEQTLINDIQIFFKNINNPVQYQLTNDDVRSFAEGRDSNDKIVKAADDPSSRRIDEIEIIEDITPVSKRTRGRKSNVASTVHVNPVNNVTKINTKSKINSKFNGRTNLYNLNNDITSQALLSNVYYFNDTGAIEYLHDKDLEVLQTITPFTYSLITQMDSITIEQAMSSSEWPEWEKAMQEELNKLNSINTWEIVDQLPPGRKALLYKWVLKKKYDIYNKLIYKARLTVKGCSQREGIDFTETFSPVAKLTAVRLVLSLGTIENLVFNQFDVQNAFPNATLSDVDIYMVAPKELYLHNDTLYLRLNRALYGLKQASREWNLLITKILLEIGFKQLTSESCIFIYFKDNIRIILALYVDDMIIGSNDNESKDWLFNQLSKNFIVKQNILTRCLGLDVTHDPKNRMLTLSRNDYARDLIKEYDHFITHLLFTTTVLPIDVQLSLSDCPNNEAEKSVMDQYPYRRILGKLNYFTCTLRCDINFAVNFLARFMVNPGIKHWHALLHLLAYIRDHPEAYITYKDPNHIKYLIDGKTHSMEPNRLYCFVDADFASSDIDSRRSVTGYVIFFNSGIISWKSSLQRRTSASTTEAEYRALHDACKECIWLTRILSEIGYEHVPPVIVFEDNTSTIAATKNPVAHSKLKHLDTIYHQIRDFIRDGQIVVTHVETQNQFADLLTKTQPAHRHQYLVENVIHVIPKHAIFADVL